MLFTTNRIPIYGTRSITKESVKFGIMEEDVVDNDLVPEILP